MEDYRVEWLGQGGFELSCGPAAIVIDPYLSDLVERLEGLKRLVPPLRSPGSLRPDLYLITHEHADHLDSDAIAGMDRDRIVFGAPPASADMLVGLRVPEGNIRRLRPGDRLEAGAFSIEAVYAKHTEDSLGFLVGCGGVEAYFTGDTELDDRVGAGIRCDAVFACINGRWGNMGWEDAATLVGRVGARLGVPHHYGMFKENDADPRPFREALKLRGVKSYEMIPGRAFSLQELLA